MMTRDEFRQEILLILTECRDQEEVAAAFFSPTHPAYVKIEVKADRIMTVLDKAINSGMGDTR